MARFVLRFPFMLAAVLLPALASAQSPPVKPGLWEVKELNDTNSARMAERMKNMPPDVRAKMEATMKQNGMDVSNGTVKVCATKESMDISQSMHRPGCKTDFDTRSSSSWKWHTVCAQPDLRTDGEAVFASSESYTISTTTTMTLNGAAKTTQHSMSAKWLGGDCGDLKPFSMKP